MNWVMITMPSKSLDIDEILLLRSESWRFSYAQFVFMGLIMILFSIGLYIGKNSSPDKIKDLSDATISIERMDRQQIEVNFSFESDSQQ